MLAAVVVIKFDTLINLRLKRKKEIVSFFHYSNKHLGMLLFGPIHQCSVAAVHDLYKKTPQKLHVNMISPAIFLKQTKNNQIPWYRQQRNIRFYP